MTEARINIYKHVDMKSLESKLSKADPNKLKMIVTDGVFSMDATVCPLPGLRRLADQYGAILVLDECHATGVIGATGRGTEEHFNMIGAADIINSTLSKALGGANCGYTAGPAYLISLLRKGSRPFFFAAAVNPVSAACAGKALDLIMDDQSR